MTGSTEHMTITLTLYCYGNAVPHDEAPMKLIGDIEGINLGYFLCPNCGANISAWSACRTLAMQTRFRKAVLLSESRISVGKMSIRRATSSVNSGTTRTVSIHGNQTHGCGLLSFVNYEP
jgi:hypothetical protein